MAFLIIQRERKNDAIKPNRGSTISSLPWTNLEGRKMILTSHSILFNHWFCFYLFVVFYLIPLFMFLRLEGMHTCCALSYMKLTIHSILLLLHKNWYRWSVSSRILLLGFHLLYSSLCLVSLIQSINRRVRPPNSSSFANRCISIGGSRDHITKPLYHYLRPSISIHIPSTTSSLSLS